MSECVILAIQQSQEVDRSKANLRCWSLDITVRAKGERLAHESGWTGSAPSFWFTVAFAFPVCPDTAIPIWNVGDIDAAATVASAAVRAHSTAPKAGLAPLRGG